MNDRQSAVIKLCDGVKTSRQIAEILNEKRKYVQEVMLKFDAPRRASGSAYGELNGSYKGGRRLDRDGYVLVTAPLGHPHARYVAKRNAGIIYEHRLVLEKQLGRYILPTETVDHIDGLRLHNDPSNLRLFQSNAQHLKATITNHVPNWSKAGRHNMTSLGRQSENFQQIDTYNVMKKSGDARLRQILLAMLQLGEGSPFLLGTSHHLEKAGISDFSHSNLTRELDKIYQKYA